MIKRANKFAACAVLSIVAFICAYLIYYTWSLAFGEVESNIEYVVRGTIYTSTDRIEKQTEPNAAVVNEEYDFKRHKNFHLFNHEYCGISSSGDQVRIHNGEPAKILKNPWAVALIYRYKNDSFSVNCAGTLVSGNF